MTEPDNAMSIPEIISRYMRGHGLAVAVLPETTDLSSREEGDPYVDDPDMMDPFGAPPAEPEPAEPKAAAQEPSSAPAE